MHLSTIKKKRSIPLKISRTNARLFTIPGLLTGALILLLFFTHVTCAYETNETIDAAGRVTVTDVTIEPSVLMTGDVGLVTFMVENTGTSNVVVTDAQLISKEIVVLNSDVYKVSRTIGAGTKTPFTFTILANQPENIYYPAFYLNYKDAGSLRYNVPIRVEEPELALAVSGIPDTFTEGVTSRIALVLGNAKSVNITGITIEPSGEGIKCNRTSAFVGNLAPHSEKSILFEIIPSVPTTLSFNVSYTCGMNSHQTSYSIPIGLGTNKRAADPIINNVEIGSESGGVSINGDVSNTGLSDAYGVVVSLESAAGDDGHPNYKYAIGTVSAGDYESFELTVPQQSGQVPLVIQYKDSSGNQFSKKVSLDLNQISGGGTMGLNNGASGAMPAGGPPGASGTTGTASSSGTRSGPGGINPMNPLSNAGNGLGNIPVTGILAGAGILVAILIIWRVWKKKSNGRKIKLTFK